MYISRFQRFGLLLLSAGWLTALTAPAGTAQPLLTGFEQIRGPVLPGPYPHRDQPNLIGDAVRVGTTWYDYQANGTLGKLIALDQDGGVHIVWMKSVDQNHAERHTFYNYVIEDEPQFDGGVEVDNADRAGYNNLGYAPAVGAIPIYHTQVGGGENYWTNIAQDAELGGGEFTGHQNPRQGGRNFVWPHGTVDRNGRTHLLSRIWPDAAGVMDMQYVRGWINDDDEWEFSEPRVVDRIKGLAYTVAASPADDRVALVWIGCTFDPDQEINRWQGAAGGAAMCNDIYVLEAEDGEEFDWDNRANITRANRPDPDADRESPFFAGDTLRPYLMVDACYDNDGNLHVVFATTMMVENPDRNAAQGWLRADDKKCYLWHWSSATDLISLIADGYYVTNGNVGAWRTNLSFPSVGVDADNNLFCAYTHYPPDGDRAANGLINGEIYVARSDDGGVTWSQAINITETNANGANAGQGASESWSTLAERVDEFLHISYIFDLDAGGIPQNEGVVTDNPVVYHRVAAEDIPSEPRILGRELHVGWPAQIELDEELPAVPGVPGGDAGQATLTVRNARQDGLTLHLRLRTSDEIAGVVRFEPSAVRIPAGEETEIAVIFTPEEVGEIGGMILIDHTATNFDSPIELEFSGIGVEGYGELSGRVIDLSNDRPVAGATLRLQPGNYRAVSDEDGAYDFGRIPAYNYRLNCLADGFLPYADEVDVGVDEQLEFGVGLSFALFELDRREVEVSVPVGEISRVRFTAENNGNGPVRYSSQIELPGGAEADPWELRAVHQFGQIVNDDRLEGVVFAGGRFYVSGARGGQPVLYVFDRAGNAVNTVPQPVEDNRGMRDLAWDGSLIWGAVGTRVFGMTPAGQVQAEFDGPANPTTTMAWDSERELLWMSGTTTDMFAVTRQGQRMGSLNRGELRLYGLDYWPEDPDGAGLYIFHRDRDNNMHVAKMNPDEGRLIPVQNFGQDSPGGAFISNTWDIYSWVFMGLTSAARDAGGDRVRIWHLASRGDWIAMAPVEGQIAGGGSEELTITINAATFPAGTELEAVIHFTHNGRGAQVDLPVLVEVTEEGGMAQRQLAFELGWNMVSLNVEPENEDLRVIFAPLVEEGLVEMVKDGRGRFYRPDFNFINIPGWASDEGYQVKLRRAANLEAEGVVIAADRPIQLEEGWQLVAYYPRNPVDVRVALAGIVDELVIAKDARGNFYRPDFNFNNMAPLREGQGYQLKMEQDVELVYQQGGGGDLAVTPLAEPTHFRAPEPAEFSYSLLVLGLGSQVREVGVFDGQGLLRGAGLSDGAGRAGVAVWGGGGSEEAQVWQMTVIGWDGSREVPVNLDWIEGDAVWTPDGYGTARAASGVLPEKYALLAPYPNPFNSRSSAAFELPEAADVALTLHDLNGREVALLASGRYPAGRHSLVVAADALPTGVYFLRLNAGGHSFIQKAAVLR